MKNKIKLSKNKKIKEMIKKAFTGVEVFLIGVIVFSGLFSFLPYKKKSLGWISYKSLKYEYEVVRKSYKESLNKNSQLKYKLNSEINNLLDVRKRLVLEIEKLEKDIKKLKGEKGK